jgi:hypothetical protein
VTDIILTDKPASETPAPAIPAVFDEKGFEIPTGPVFVERKLADWSDLEGRVLAEAEPAPGATPPEGWSRFYTNLQIQIPVQGRGMAPYQERVNIPANTPGEAMAWLVANMDRLAPEIRKRGEMEIAKAMRRVVPAPAGGRFGNQ